MAKKKKPQAQVADAPTAEPIPQKKTTGRKQMSLSAEMRDMARRLFSLGMNMDEVAAITGYSRRVLEREAAEEKKAGMAQADAKVLANLLTIATGNTPQAATAAIFWTKVRRRWHEVSRVIHGFDPAVMRDFVVRTARIFRESIPRKCRNCGHPVGLEVAIGKMRQLSSDLQGTLPEPEIVAAEVVENKGLEST